MSIIAFYKYLGKGKIKPVAKEDVKDITNPSAICTVNRIMVLQSFNQSFTLEEVKEITEFVQSLNKKKDENKSSNCNNTSGV
jgi:acyl CoA:acetate/3-ketoacid CoA transferase beta subunit